MTSVLNDKSSLLTSEMNDLLDEQWTLSKKCENRKHFNSHLYPIGILFVFKLHYQKYLYILSDFNLRVDQSKNEIQHTKITSNLKVWQFIHSFQEALSFCQYKPVAQLPQQLSWFQKLVTWVQIKQGAKTWPFCVSLSQSLEWREWHIILHSL